MNFTKYFVLFVVLLAVLTTGAEAGFLKKLGKKLEKVGKNVHRSVEKVLPAAQGVIGVLGSAKALGK
ncbi:cecropin-A-like [Lutzomyia longipalpis]|uniref:Cecropin n=1 Tax=Lutzomyia longipalpis TaxID=7200 RepID=A0A0K1NZR1_LUTLO|nr:cecropin-A-like [Lutzomyia longipalpis]AKU77023.1 Cecropin [Lutzomyia longipalpis]